MLPTGSFFVVKVATPPMRGAFPILSNNTFSPSGGGPALEVTVAVKVTASPSVEGFGEEVSVVLVMLACAFASNTVPAPLAPPAKVVPYR